MCNHLNAFWALLEGAKAPSTSKSRPQISSPINFDHVLHVGFNGETGEFEGLPKEWEAHLQNSNISKKERQENPETIIAVSWNGFQIDASTKWLAGSIIDLTDREPHGLWAIG